MGRLFSRGVLLDGTALQALQDIGLSDLAGAEVKSLLPRRSMAVGPEELTDPDFAGGRNICVWARWRWGWAMG